MKEFTINRGTTIKDTIGTKPVKNAIAILKRDIDAICLGNDSSGVIELELLPAMESESYEIHVSESRICINASDDLGFVYGLLRVSSEFLNVKPFWFWMDQQFEKKQYVSVKPGTYESPKYVVKFRGWFFNDEVLMLGWKANDGKRDGWRMCFETLLRCGGNMCIPGTDKEARRNKELASEYGLWITHHHAEPLGAEMFARAYPNLEADYFKYPDKFEKLWEDAAIQQKDMKVVWNLCFRGQGDRPFWLDDKEGKYDTDAKRGAVITELMQKQADIVKKYVDNPVFCTNLYGEILELYKDGHITFPEGAIFVRADNGYGKMVTRRRGNHNPRVDAMPCQDESNGQGIYYHVSFYDLQAANHITTLPNSVDFVNRELEEVLNRGGKDYWVINCSNVRPHTYFLDVVAKKWLGRDLDDETQAREFAKDYFSDNAGIKNLYMDYPNITISFGTNEDEHAGEQFYAENARYLAHYFLLNNTDSIKEMHWLTGQKPIMEQVDMFEKLCQSKHTSQADFLKNALKYADTTIALQAKMHYYGARACVSLCQGIKALSESDYAKSFELLGDSAHDFEYINYEMLAQSKGRWENFYANDCQADFKFSAYEVRKLMGYVRELGDNSEHYSWQHEYCYAKEDKGVCLLLLTSNHVTDEQLYQAMKSKK